MQSEGFDDNFSLGKSMHLVGWKIITVFIIKLIFFSSKQIPSKETTHRTKILVNKIMIHAKLS